MARLAIRIVGTDMPGANCTGYENIHVGVQRGREVVDLVPGDAPGAVFDLFVEAAPGAGAALDFRGPFVHGDRGDRFIYLSWGALDPDAGFQMFRRAKLRPSDASSDDVRHAIETGAPLEAHLSMKDRRGNPVCASLRPPAVQWRLGQLPA